ncbi:uncharacterized protein LOC126678182 isoform X2 [Mercurialis annua]|uniref:uncharacterized protein LOC126678182 isoform X2 n=1 Tax=Mercurialis annua TaxID=3986 RepID=UPI00215F6C35|nr:uncharacterized protein LOC126678182 isoform X2 [Mercurialis annua]
MGAKKRKHRALTKQTPSNSSVQPPFQGLNAANLKKLYAKLLHLSLNNSTLESYNCDSGYMGVDDCGGKLKSKDIYDLSHTLFRELDIRFKELFSALDNGSTAVVMDVWASDGELILVLRCCLVMLGFVEFDHGVLIEKGKVLLSILGRLISFELSVDGGTEFVASKASLRPSNLCCEALCAVLEVFADELLVNKLLREYLMLVDSTSSRSDVLFNCHFGYGNIGSVLEVVCSHFILSVSSEQAVVNFIDRLFWCPKDFRIPEISLPAALSLLLNPVVLSAPKMFLAHLILLVSETIGVCKASKNTPDVQLADWYSTAFERSVMLYTRHTSNLFADSHKSDDNGSFVRSSLHGYSTLKFESFLLPATLDKLHHLTAKSKSLWDSYLNEMSCRTNTDLVASSFAYVKDNICNFDESRRGEILSIVSCIILGCSSDGTCGTLFEKGDRNPQDTHLLASILKLMSSSMLQLIRYVRCVLLSGGSKSSGDLSSCKEYNSILRIVCSFEHLSIHPLRQNHLHRKMQSYPARYKNSKWMLLHLSGLLSSSYIGGIHFLVNGCLFTLMTLLDLFAIEEGDLGTLGSLCRPKLSYSSKSSDSAVEGVLVVRKSSRLISLKFQNIRDIQLRRLSEMRKQGNQAETSEYFSAANDLKANNVKEICNDGMFLKILLGKNAKKSDFDELANFIEFEPGKDYLSWWKNLRKHREWRSKKTLQLSWKKRKVAWKVR